MEYISRNQRMVVEVKEIFKYIDSRILNKIPSDIIEKFQNVEDDSYKFEYDTTKTLKEQKISEDTKNMISYLYIRRSAKLIKTFDITGIHIVFFR